MNRDLSVRRLAEFAFRSGDLYMPRAGKPIDAEEGVRVQRLVQGQRAADIASFESEVSVAAEIEVLGEPRKLAGRIDGVITEDDHVTIEEYKCVRTLPDAANSVDLGQAMIYAGLWALQHEHMFSAIEVALIYVEPGALQERKFVHLLSPAQAASALAFVLTCYEVRLQRHCARTEARVDWLRDLEFPYKRYRPGQLGIARRVFLAQKRQENLLLEAPTGSGKTMGVLYSAFRAQGCDDQLFFLTGRNSGARAALEAVRDVDPEREHISVVELTAKEKICFTDGMPCDPDLCTYACGYFDRSAAAVDSVINAHLADRATIESIAREHEVCPFELSLDAALWADIVVGDYNYIFDPVVRLQRFIDHPNLHLLIDEAHNLRPRAQDMLAVTIERAEVRAAKRAVPDRLVKRVESIDRALMRSKRALDVGEQVVPDVGSISRALERFVSAIDEEDPRTWAEEAKQLLFTAYRWQRSEQWYEPETFVHLADVSKRSISVHRVCLDPARYLAKVMNEHSSVVRFSGTVSPMPLYQRLHGANEQPHERAPSPFQPEQAAVLAVRDVPTYFRSRERSIAKLAGVVASTVAARSGRYLLALPSYDYLERLTAELQVTDLASHGLIVQAPRLTNPERDALLDEFSSAEHCVLCVVMGGVFSESVDFADMPLTGVIVVGIGLPPPSLQRELTSELFDDEEGAGWGKLAAYTQPAMSKVVQAAGRLIRTPEDRGVICLVDPRYTDPGLQQFFPDFWRPRALASHELPQVLHEFWDAPTIAPRVG